MTTIEKLETLWQDNHSLGIRHDSSSGICGEVMYCQFSGTRLSAIVFLVFLPAMLAVQVLGNFWHWATGK